MSECHDRQSRKSRNVPSPFASMIFTRDELDPVLSPPLFLPFLVVYRRLCARRFRRFLLLIHIYIHQHLRQPPRLPPTHTRRTEEPLMTSPFMNTDYSSEVGTIKDYREQAPFCYAGRHRKKERGYKSIRTTFHLHVAGTSTFSFSYRSSNYTLALPFFYYTPDHIFSADD